MYNIPKSKCNNTGQSSWLEAWLGPAKTFYQQNLKITSHINLKQVIKNNQDKGWVEHYT